MRTAKLAVMMVAALGVAACQDLDTSNLNAPDQARALSSPNDVESLIRGGFRNWYSSIEHGAYPTWALSTGADEMSSSWGHNGMQQFSSEPRVAYPNDLVFGYRNLTASPWSNMYEIISNMNDGLKTIADGMKFGENGADTKRAEAWALFNSGMAHAWIALQYDKGFIFKETDDLETTEFEFVDYEEMMTYALSQLDRAKEIASANNFTFDSDWIFGREMSSAEFERVINSYQARFLASVARTPEERAAAPWQRIIDLANAGVTEDWGPVLGGTNSWGAQYKAYMGKFDWFRGDYKLLGPADVSGKYKEWLDTPAAERQPFTIATPDRRIQGEAGPESKGKFWTYRLPQNFREDRGTYHFSRYFMSRWPTLQPNHQTSAQTGLNPIVPLAEMDLLKAEGYIRTNRADQAVPLINKTRVGVGELPPVTVSGVPQAADCVPRWDGVTCGTLMQALMYEKRIQNAGAAGGVAYFDARGWGILVPGTQLHFPVPARELDILKLPFYRFGGVGDPWAAK
jgi:hypothetical protein